MRILVVDDSKAMRMIVRRTLRQAGFGHHQTDEACDGREAFDAIKANAPDLVISDWNMPEMSGIQLLEALNEAGIGVPFGFVTTEGTQDMRERASGAGAKFLIVKPFTAQHFTDALQPLLS